MAKKRETMKKNSGQSSKKDDFSRTDGYDGQDQSGPNGTKEARKGKDQKKGSPLKEFYDTIIYIAVVCLVVFLVLHFIGQRTVVRGDSMENSLTNGENLIMDKISYRFSDPKRFDIIIFPGPEEYGEHPYYIKRIIGLPGETVQIKDGLVYIDGRQLKEDVYGITDYIEEAHDAERPITLKEDEYFCLGDNRPVSYDSRYPEVGPVTRSEIIGKVWIRIWPLRKFGKV